MNGIGILGTGAYLPHRVVSNEEVAALVPGADPDWIERRTKIRHRRYAAPDEAASDLSAHAGRAALEQAHLDGVEVDFIIVATSTGDSPVPATASLVQHALGARRAACFDLNIACAGFVTALAVARALIVVRPGAKALVIGVDVWSRFVDFGDRATSVLFGDGAGAAVVGAVDAAPGFLELDMVGRGDAHDLIWIDVGGSRQPPTAESVEAGGHYLRMQGRPVRDFVLANVPGIIADLLKRNGLTAADVDHFVPHQANGALVGELAEACGLAGATTHLPLVRTGNIGSASVPVALDDANRSGALRDGDLVLLAGFGAGMAVGAGLLRWTTPPGSAT
jgi:3-oxoacyl-[acyl-carrier-protein] synthase-3